MFGSFRANPARPWISETPWDGPKAGMAVILMPLAMIQTISPSDQRFWVSVLWRVGGLGYRPSTNSAGETPGAPWQVRQESWKWVMKPSTSVGSGFSRSSLWAAMDRLRTVSMALKVMSQCFSAAAML